MTLDEHLRAARALDDASGDHNPWFADEVLPTLRVRVSAEIAVDRG